MNKFKPHAVPLMALVAMILMLLPMQSVLAVGTPVFINEIHYDNTGTDEGESIEVAGPAGTDLTGWSIVLYNGSNGTVYDTDALIGTIPSQQGGYGTVVLTYPANGLQNGSPDGIALVDPASNVMQFLSYEGSLTAVGGVADGMLSTDIGVAESSSTAVGASLQLEGFGTLYEDFTWTGEQANTFGGINTGQTFDGVETPVLIINEIDYDQPGTDTAEFVEIKNTGTGSADLSEYTLELVNGNGGAVYLTIALSGSLAAGDYFVVCGDAATVANCDLDVTPDSNLIQNGAPDAVGLKFNGVLIDAVSYEGDTAAYTEGSGNGLADAGVDGSISRCPDGVDTNQNNTDLKFTGTSTPGIENNCPAPPPPVGVCGDPATLISAIQGSGSASPLTGTNQVIEAIVVGDFQETSVTNPPRPELSGFFVQEEDADNDADPATSEGLWIFDPAKTLDVAEGDHVRVSGTVSEAFGNTQLDTISGVLLCGTGETVTPAALDLPVPLSYASIDDYYEMFEGMQVQFVDTMSVTEQFELARYGQMVLSEGGRLRQYGQDGSIPLNQSDFDLWQDSNTRRSIKLDDYNNQQNIDPVFHPAPGNFAVNNFIRMGATINNLTGVLEYRFSEWNVQPQKTAPVSFSNPPRPAAPVLAGNLVVGSLNVLNYFNGDGLGGGFPTSRGADSAAELQRQTDKIVAAIVAMNPDVLGLMEIENDGDGANESLAYLANAINVVAGPGTYDYVHAGLAGGGDEIKVGILYKPAVVTPAGSAQVLATAAFTDPNDIGSQQNRPAVTQTFQVTDAGNSDVDEAFTAVVLHLKSKGSGCGAGDDSLIEGSCSDTRRKANIALLDWLATDPTNTVGNLGKADTDVLILGDLNSYYQELPMQVLYQAGYINQLPQNGYTYVFDGQLGSLDQAVASPSMDVQVISSASWHINSDENALLDYNDTVSDTSEASFEVKPATNPLYAPDAFRGSDHDPVLLGLNLISPPVVESTDPVDGASEVDLGANVSITFNKAVNLTAAAFTISCNSSGSHSFSLSGGPETWLLNPDADFHLTESCTVTVVSAQVDDVADGTPMEDDYVFSFTTSGSSRAVIQVAKNFNDGNPGMVNVQLNCFTGLPLIQGQDISEGQSVQFIVTSFQPGELTCSVTEEVPDGYEASYSTGFATSETGCNFTGIMTTSQQNCLVTNSLLPVDVEVTKQWLLSGMGSDTPLLAEAEYECFNVAQLDAPDQCDADCVVSGVEQDNTLEFEGLKDTQSFAVYPDWDGSTWCQVTENVVGSGVEIDDSDCQHVSVKVGQESAGCTIVNTLFYEGIPTLSQYGLAILALLMLGIGAVGFRRFA